MVNSPEGAAIIGFKAIVVRAVAVEVVVAAAALVAGIVVIVAAVAVAVDALIVVTSRITRAEARIGNDKSAERYILYVTKGLEYVLYR